MKINFIFKIEYYIYILFMKMLCLFSLNKRYKIAGFLGRLIYKIGKKRRSITHKNIKTAFPDYDEKKVKEVAIASYENISKSFLEVFWIDELKMDIYGTENLKKGLEKAKGIVLVSMHFGNWEYGGYKLAEIGFPITAVAKKQKNKYINDLIDKMRKKSGLKIIPKGKNFKSIIKVLKDNEILGLISDQYSGEVAVKFFGVDTGAVEGPARLARKYDAPVLFVYTVRQKDEYHSIYVSEELDLNKTENEEEDIKSNTQKIINKMEEIIKENPNQWFWQHKRWKKTIEY